MQLFHNENPCDSWPEEDFNCVAATGNVTVARFPTVFYHIAEVGHKQN